MPDLCFHCRSEAVTWDSDFDFEDFGFEGEGIVHVLHCSCCGSEILYKVPIESKKEEKKLKAFISQPMKDKTNEEIKAEREKAIASLKKKFGEDIEIIDSFFEDAPHDAKPLWFLGKSIQLLSNADVAYFCKGWAEARGCKIENTCAIEYGLEVIEDYK